MGGGSKAGPTPTQPSLSSTSGSQNLPGSQALVSGGQSPSPRAALPLSTMSDLPQPSPSPTFAPAQAFTMEAMLSAAPFHTLSKNPALSTALVFPLLRSHFPALPWETTGRKAPSEDISKAAADDSAANAEGKDGAEVEVEETTKAKGLKDKVKKMLRTSSEKIKSPVGTPSSKTEDKKSRAFGSPIKSQTSEEFPAIVDEDKSEQIIYAPDIYDDQQNQIIQELSKKLSEYETILHTMSASWTHAETVDRHVRSQPEFARTGLPIGPSQYSIDPILQQKQHLIDVERLMPLTIEPTEKLRSRAPSYLMQTASTASRTPRSRAETTRNFLRSGSTMRSNSSSVKPLVQSTEVDQMADSLAKGSNYDAIEIYGGKKKARHAWMESMTSYQREVEKAVLKKMIFRSDFLKNPRFEPEKSKTLKPGQEMEPFPSVIHFTDFLPHQVYEIPLVLRNISSISRRVRVLPPRTPYFSVTLARYPTDDGLIAPGMKCQYMIRFAPDSFADHEDELAVITENHRFCIPIHATRPPPQLSVPTVFDCGAALIGSVKTVQFSCTNSGGTGSFKIFPEIVPVDSLNQTQNDENDELILEPFHISPTSFSLDQGESMQLQVKFCPNSPLIYGLRFQIACDNCQTRYFSLSGHGCVPAVEIYDVEGYPVGKSQSHAGQISFGDHSPGSVHRKKIRVKNVTGVDLPYHWETYYIPFIKPNLSFLPGILPPLSPPAEELVSEKDAVFFVSPSSGAISAHEMVEFAFDYQPRGVGLYEQMSKLVVDSVPSLSAAFYSDKKTKQDTSENVGSGVVTSVSESFTGLQVKLDGKGITTDVHIDPCTLR